MVPVDYMIRAALRWNTAMSRAMLRACGISVPHACPGRGRIAAAGAYDGVAACFANRESPMDGR